MGCCKKGKNIYEKFQCSDNCKCSRESCGCPIKLPTECVRYTGTETETLKKNKNLDDILQEIEQTANKQQFIIGAGIKKTETPIGTILSIDEEWLTNFIENV